MAKRPLFIVSLDKNIFKEIEIEFKFFNGFSISQKAKSIESMHSAAKKLGYKNILEVSTKSSSKIGWSLSAFNLEIEYNGKKISLESAFQGSKVFKNNIQYTDLYLKEPIEAKKDERLKSSGNIIGFKFNNIFWENEPKSAFYDWLYINALNKREDLIKELLSYSAFTDIEFNPKKSINCQARSCAIFVSLYKQNLLKEALQSKDAFIKIVYKKNPKQGKFDFN